MWDLLLWCAGSFLRHVGFSLVVACGFSLLSLWCAGSRARGLCSCGAWVPELVGFVVCGTQALVEARELSSCGA